MNLAWLKSISPLAARLASYTREMFAADLIAGAVVAVMLIPQAMAYAMLAGLPPQIGLYASILPLVLYAIFGTSNSLAVGPVAMISLLVVSGVGELATPGSERFIQLCLTLALLVGLFQIVMSFFRLGFLVNFISHPVLVGFTSSAAIIIAFSQIKHLFGISIESGERPYEMISHTISNIPETNLVTMVVGLISCLVLIFFAYRATPLLTSLGLSKTSAAMIAKTGPLVAVVLAAVTIFVTGMNQSHAVAIVGEIPAGLPRLSLPEFDLESIRSLFPLALVITLVGYLESISVAKALASRKREKIDANRELFALGMADVGAAFTGGYPVTGGFSRSLVNDSAGVVTPLGSIITATLVAIALLLLTPFFFYIPKAVLAAIIVVAVTRLIDFKTPIKLWRYSRADAFSLIATFASVLAFGIETGILIGVVSTIVLMMWKTSRPHVAEVGRVGQSEHFRNVRRYPVTQHEKILALRIDESLNFANAPYLESLILREAADRPEITSVLLIASGINDIDATGIDVIETIKTELDDMSIRLCLSDVKGPVSDRLAAAGFDPEFLENDVFLSAHLAVSELSNAEVSKQPTSSPTEYHPEPANVTGP